MLVAVLAIAPAADAAWVNRHLLRELTARPPVAPGTEPTLDTARLETCLRTARNLDRMALLIDNQLIVIQDTAAHIDYLRRRLEEPQLPRPGRTEKETRIELDRHAVERAEMQRLLDRDTKAYRSQLVVYDRDVKAFQHDCAGSFRKQDLDTARARLENE